MLDSFLRSLVQLVQTKAVGVSDRRDPAVAHMVNRAKGCAQLQADVTGAGPATLGYENDRGELPAPPSDPFSLSSLHLSWRPTTLHSI